MNNITPHQQKALHWLQNEIKGIPNFKSKNEHDEVFTLKNRQHPPICELVLFNYFAQHGNASGYWDKYPIVLMVRPLPEHFFGFNIHYLPIDIREKILTTLHNIHDNNKNREFLFKIIYPMLDGLVKSKQFNYAYKNYSYKNIASKFVTINPTYYKLIKDLPIAVAVKNNEEIK